MWWNVRPHPDSPPGEETTIARQLFWKRIGTALARNIPEDGKRFSLPGEEGRGEGGRQTMLATAATSW